MRGFAAVAADIGEIKGEITEIKGEITGIKGDIPSAAPASLHFPCAGLKIQPRERECRFQPAHAIQRWENEMNTEQLLHLRRSIEAQLCWALRHNGDEELVDILRSESERLSAPRPSG
jgi:hypothetical protein